MKFLIEMNAEVADHDADIMAAFPSSVLDRFRGTAINISNIQVKKDD